MSQKSIVASCFAVIFGFITAAYFIQGNQLARNIYFLIPPLLAVVMGVYATDTYGLKSIHGKSMALLSAGMLCLFIGECLFMLFQFELDIDPFPSVADIFYLSAYPLIFAGLIAEIRHHDLKWDDSNKHIYILMLLFLALLTPIIVYFGVYLAWNSSDTFLTNIIAIGYGINDLILLIPSLFVLKITLGYRGGKLFNTWMWILFAIIFMMVADVLFASFKDGYERATWPYSQIDLIWAASYLMFAYSFFYTADTIQESREKLRAKKLKRKKA